jgi:hypothetical protein
VTYPQRPPVFPLKLQKLLLREKVAESIDPLGCWLLVAVASAEDDRGCRGPVGLWNDQLAALIGVGTEARLDRARRKCVDHGWLHYERGTNRRQGIYFVTIPEPYSLPGKVRGEERSSSHEIRCRTHADRPTKSGVETLVEPTTQPTSHAASANDSTNDIGGHNVGPPSLFPSSPSSRGEEPVVAVTPETRKKPPRKPSPQPRLPNPMFDVIVEVTGLDAKLNGSLIGRTAADLTAAGYTLDDVREFGRRYLSICTWARGERDRPTIGEIPKYIGLLRAGPVAHSGDGPRIKRASDNGIFDWQPDPTGNGK